MKQCFDPEGTQTIQKKYYTSNITFKHGTDQRQQVKKYFQKAFEMEQILFSMIKDQQTFYERPQPLRHPLIFYYGHTAAFIVNKLIDAGILKKRINQYLERVLAVGVDQNSWDDLNQSHYNWPTLKEVKTYRNQVKQTFIQVLKNVDSQITWTSHMWAVLMGIQHQKVHIQTSAAIIRRIEIQKIRPSSILIDCPYGTKQISQIPKNRLLKVPDFNYKFSMSKQTTDVFRWDMELGKKQVSIKSFEASQFLVSNGEFYEFYSQKGYQKMEYWTDQGKKWVSWSKVKHPIFWYIQKERSQSQTQDQFRKSIKLKTVNYLTSMKWDWPVQVNNLQARAFCKWKSQKQGCMIRLQNQDQYLAIRTKFEKEQNTWQYQKGGNINLQYWFSPCPVNMFKYGDFYDVLGNSWQHIDDALYPYENFQINPYYEDVSSSCMDGKHDILRGGSFCSLGNYGLGTYRNYFRRHFYTFASFRYVAPHQENTKFNDGTNKSIIQYALQCDKQIQKTLNDHYIDKTSYIFQCEAIIRQYITSEKNNKKRNKSLVIGCSVGKLSFILGEYFNKSYGIDSSVRYFNLAVRLLEQTSIKYKQKQIKIDENIIKIKDRIRFYQFDASNIDDKKANRFDTIVIEGSSIGSGKMRDIIQGLFQNRKLINQEGDLDLWIIKDKLRMNEVQFEEANIKSKKVQKINEWKIQSQEDQNKSLCYYKIKFDQ